MAYHLFTWMATEDDWLIVLPCCVLYTTPMPLHHQRYQEDQLKKEQQEKHQAKCTIVEPLITSAVVVASEEASYDECVWPFDAKTFELRVWLAALKAELRKGALCNVLNVSHLVTRLVVATGHHHSTAIVLSTSIATTKADEPACFCCHFHRTACLLLASHVCVSFIFKNSF